ncbi:MAG: metallophosphoesterase [Parachlamydiaceae bacterium]|nr:metallophosphoesterase [Parachlamydiaceae bacterium]
MAVWAIADLHLSFGVPNKNMDVFGPQWIDYTKKIENQWKSNIAPSDLVLISGDISWAKYPEDAAPDFQWIDQLPGTKILIKGNHDFWWGSLKKLKPIIPKSCLLLQNNSYQWDDIAIAGARLWDIPDLSFADVIDYKKNDVVKQLTEKDDTTDSEIIYKRELGRLEASLKAMNSNAKIRIAMTHYPPIGVDFTETEASRLLEKYQVNHCIFGHLHNVKPNLELFGVHNGIHYHLTACDYLKDFKPKKII